MIWFYFILFWSLSIAFVVYFFYKPLKNNTVQQTNASIAKEKIQQLELEFKNGALDKVSFEEAKKDILKTLTLDEENQKKTVNKNNYSKSLLISIVAVSLSVLLFHYHNLGSPENTEIKQAQPSVQSLLFKMEQHLTQNPQDVKAWSMLGQTYFSMQQLQKANNAFTKAYELNPNDADIILSLASGLAAINNNQLLGKPVQLIQKVLQKNPNNVKALWLAGYATYQAGNYPLAQKTWEKTYNLMAKNDPERTMIAQYIKDIKRLQNERNANSKITVSISLAKSINANPNDFVMVYARTPTGMKMPVAIKKIRVADLPTTVILTDEDAAMPTRKLSQMTEVIVFVRLSKTGQAIQQADDIVVQSGVLNPNNKPELSLQIK